MIDHGGDNSRFGPDRHHSDARSKSHAGEGDREQQHRESTYENTLNEVRRLRRLGSIGTSRLALGSLGRLALWTQTAVAHALGPPAERKSGRKRKGRRSDVWTQ